MASLPQAFVSPQEYLDVERKAEFKSEYLNGEVFAMSGAREAHVLIEANLTADFVNQLRDKPCRVYTSNMRVRVNPKGSYLYAYPDLSVTCEKPKFEDGHLDTLLNPLILIEVLSKSTTNYDRETKAPLYRKLESLREYLLVSQTTPHLERYARQTGQDDWHLTDVEGLESFIQLASLPVTLKLGEVYRQVEFAATQ